MADLSQYIEAGLRLLLVGPPGIAKTARIAAAAEQTGRRLVVIRASLSERVDIGGALVPDAAAGVTKELPLATLHDLQHTQTPTVLLLDDLGQAPMDVQAACMRLFDKGYLPPHVLIWGATNRPGDKAGVSALCEPLRSRFDLAFTIATPETTHDAGGPRPLATWKDEVAAWCAWAQDNGAPPELVAWHRSTNGRTLYAWSPSADPAARMPDFRTWETVLRMHKAGIADLESLSAAIGGSAAVEYSAFRSLADEVPALSVIEEAPDTAPIPESAGAMWICATAIGSVIGADTAGAYLTYLERLPRAYAAMAVRDAYRRNDPALCRSKDWSRWFLKNQDIFK